MDKITLIQINSILGNLIFEFECETIKEVVVEAIQNNVNLRGANLRGANLSGANLSGANLSKADLYGANLYVANLSWSDLHGADLSKADLSWSDLHGADLSKADLYGADLSGADLSGAKLRGANLSKAKNSELVQAQTVIAPEGDIIGWKKCKDGILVKLLIPKEAKRSNSTGRKCRAEYVEVLELIDLNDKTKKVKEAISQHNGETEYVVGKTVKCDKWDEERFNECSGGIHFFITRIEAEKY